MFGERSSEVFDYSGGSIERRSGYINGGFERCIDRYSFEDEDEEGYDYEAGIFGESRSEAFDYSGGNINGGYNVRVRDSYGYGRGIGSVNDYVRGSGEEYGFDENRKDEFENNNGDDIDQFDEGEYEIGITGGRADDYAYSEEINSGYDFGTDIFSDGSYNPYTYRDSRPNVDLHEQLSYATISKCRRRGNYKGEIQDIGSEEFSVDNHKSETDESNGSLQRHLRRPLRRHERERNSFRPFFRTPRRQRQRSQFKSRSRYSRRYRPVSSYTYKYRRRRLRPQTYRRKISHRNKPRQHQRKPKRKHRPSHKNRRRPLRRHRPKHPNNSKYIPKIQYKDKHRLKHPKKYETKPQNKYKSQPKPKKKVQSRKQRRHLPKRMRKYRRRPLKKYQPRPGRFRSVRRINRPRRRRNFRTNTL